jgi:hypothetical protein
LRSQLLNLSGSILLCCDGFYGLDTSPAVEARASM